MTGHDEEYPMMIRRPRPDGTWGPATSDGRSVPVHDAAHALSAFRCLPNGDGRKYSATTFPQDPWRGCEHIIRTARAVGYLSDDHTNDDYAVLDVLNVDGDIVQDFAIPTSTAFRWFRRKLDLVVEASDAQ